MDNIPMQEVVTISPAWSTEVELKRDFQNPEENRRKLTGYVPSSASRRALEGICEGLYPHSRKRAHLVTGPRGTGKSHFSLVLANFLCRDLDDPDVKPLFDILSADEKLAESIRHARQAVKRYLVVIPDPAGDPEGFDHASLVSLKEALEGEGIDFRPPSSYLAAADTVRRWRGEHEEAYAKLQNELSKRGTSVDILIAQLENYSPEAYETFREAHKAVAYGTEFRPEFSSEPARVYADTARFLRNQGEWQGIFVVCDEFGRYLSQIARDPNTAESLRIQGFLEFCKRSEQDQVHIVAVAHQSLQAYAGGQKTQQELEKLYGRFLDSEYYIQAVSNDYEMERMTDSIIVQHGGGGWRSVCEHPDIQLLVDLALDMGLYPDKDRAWVEKTVVRGCYPMHPLAMFCVPWLADRVGQENRSLFCFFAARDEGGLTHFVENHSVLDEVGRLELYTVDLLAIYFHSAMQKSDDYRRVALAIEQALPACGGVSLAERVVRVLGVLEIVGNPKLPARQDVIADALWLTPKEKGELQGVLSELVERGAIRYRKSSREYSLRYLSGGIDVEEEIGKEMLRISDSLDLAEVMNKRHPNGRIGASAYNEKHFTNREATCRFVRSAQLANPAGFITQLAPGRDVVVLYVLPETDEEIMDARQHLQQEPYQHRQLVVALPKSPVSFRESLLRYQAISNLYASSPFSDRGSPEKEDLDGFRDDEEKVLKGHESQFLAPGIFVWFNAGNSVGDVSDASAYLSGVVESVFPKTPAIRDRAINEFVTTDSSKAQRREALDRILRTTGPFTIRKDEGPAEDRILRNCLRDTELLDLRADKGAYQEFVVRTSPPRDSLLAEIWDLVSEVLVGDKLDDKASCADQVVGPLRIPPYGLRPQATEVILGTFLATVKDECAIFSGYRDLARTGSAYRLEQHECSGSAMYSLVRDPGDWVIYYYRATDQEKEYIQKLRAVVPGEAQESEGVGLWESGRRTILRWFGELPSLTKSSSEFDAPECKELIALLLDSEQTREAKALLKTGLPRAMGVEPTDDSLPYDTVTPPGVCKMVSGLLLC